MNGYPDHVIEKTIARKLKDFTSSTSHIVKKCPVYLHFPWLGTLSVGLENKICAKNYSDGKFIILSFGRSSFRLSALEAVYIKSYKPNLCRQKEFV